MPIDMDIVITEDSLDNLDIVRREDSLDNLDTGGLGVGVDLNGKRHRTLIYIDLDNFDRGTYYCRNTLT